MPLKIDYTKPISMIAGELLEYQYLWIRIRKTESFDETLYTDIGCLVDLLPQSVIVYAKRIKELKIDAVRFVVVPIVGIYFQINGLRKR